MNVPSQWLLLLYGLPTRRSAERVSLWRKLKKFGALQLKTSAYVLPEAPLNRERFQWLAQQVRDAGGEATLIRVSEIEGLPDEEIVRLFHDAKTVEYRDLARDLSAFMKRHQRGSGSSFAAELDKFSARWEEIKETDFFECPAAHDAEQLLSQAKRSGEAKGRRLPKLDRKRFQGRIWLTRPRPEIDRVGSAWLIRRFIDAKAEFVFAPSAKEHEPAIPFDIFNAEFTHSGEDCTFETLCKRFGLEDAALRKISEMVHDADLEDGKFQRPECAGLDLVFKGWARLGWTDEEILARGFDCFDALRAAVRQH